MTDKGKRVLEVEEEEVNEISSRKNSDAWLHFKKYVDKQGLMRAKCNYCTINYATHSGQNRTTSMNRHIKSKCKGYQRIKASEDARQKCLLSKRTIHTYVEGGPNNCTLGMGTTFNKENARKSLAEMVVVDKLCFSFVEKCGFRNFCQINLPKFDVPSRRTLVRDIIDLHVSHKGKLMSYFKANKVRVCLTTNTWTSIQNINYIVVTAHYIDDCWQLHKKILSFSPITDHRGESIGKYIEKVLLHWGIESVFTVTVDNASSNNVAINYLKRKLNSWNGTGAILGGKYLHLRCCAHIVNLIVGDGLKDVHESVATIRNAVKYVKSSPSRLGMFKRCISHEKIPDKSLVVLDVVTRWNSTYLMLENALKFQKAFERMEEDDGHYLNYFNENEDNHARSGPPKEDDWSNANVFVQLLKPFYDITAQFSASLSVTSTLYFHKWVAINNQLKAMGANDDQFVSHMAANMRVKFDKYWGSMESTNRLLIIAVILDPRYKLKYVSYCLQLVYGDTCSDLMTSMIKDSLIELYDQYSIILNASTQDAALHDEIIGDDVIDVVNSDLGRRGGGTGFIMDATSFDVSNVYVDIDEDGDDVGVNEVEIYLAEKNERNSTNFDILKWWSVFSAKYSVLGLIARDVFAMPISTVASESAFSTGGRVLDPFRSSLTPEMVECLICTQNWMGGKFSNVNEAVSDSLLETQQFYQDITQELDAKLLEDVNISGPVDE